MSNDRDSRASGPVSTCREPRRGPIICTKQEELSHYSSVADPQGLRAVAVVEIQECKFFRGLPETGNTAANVRQSVTGHLHSCNQKKWLCNSVLTLLILQEPW